MKKDTSPKLKSFEVAANLSLNIDVVRHVGIDNFKIRIIHNLLNSLLYQMFDYQLEDLINGFISQDDPLYKLIIKRINKENLPDLYPIYFTESSISNLFKILTEYFKNVS
ncbi:MAG: hypothetical protein NC548_26095 [Lachnospiraceae bacterium]|nr:hypothetical protein [Lachnospiraceae bacterium]